MLVEITQHRASLSSRMAAAPLKLLGARALSPPVFAQRDNSTAAQFGDLGKIRTRAVGTMQVLLRNV